MQFAFHVKNEEGRRKEELIRKTCIHTRGISMTLRRAITAKDAPLNIPVPRNDRRPESILSC